MLKRIIHGTMVAFLSIGMLMLIFNIQPVEAKPRIWTLDGGRQAAFYKMQEGSTSTYSSPALNESTYSRKWSTPNIDTFEPPSMACRKWNLNNGDEWGNFSSNNSAQLVVGLSDNELNGYSKLVDLIVHRGGEVVNTVSMGGKIRAVVANIPPVEMHAFVLEAQAANLSKYVEPNLTFEIDFVPNDPDWTQQWAAGKIEADYAWNTTTGDSSVLVAVIDTGIDWDHPDLAANYVSLGYDWVNDDADPMDDHGHGTHCAGIIAAAINNSIGIAGLAQVRIMGEKAFAPTGHGTDDDCANAIAHAVDQGADILSLSWGSYSDSTLVHEAIKYAHDAGVLVVASAGNDGTRAKHFPSCYPEVIAVSATQKDDSPASWTNRGDSIELAAPGVNIYSTVWNDSYKKMSGTSMAAPHVAGVVALVWSRFPNISRDQVRAQLRYTADDLGGSGFDAYYGYGRVNARRAVEQDLPDHDLLVFDFEIPQFMQLYNTAIIGATVLNFGTTNESNVVTQLYVNESLVNSTVFGFMASGAMETVSFSWIPKAEASYNMTFYVMPVENEAITENNVLFKHVSVRTLRVPGKYPTIQGAINAAVTGETILVSSGTYHEHVVVNKTVRLIGQNRNTTIIDGGGTGSVIQVKADYVYVSGFTMRNGGICIRFHSARGGITFCGNTVTDSTQGMDLYSSFGCNISYNIIRNNRYMGIEIDSWGAHTTNVIAENVIVNNSEGIFIYMSGSNLIRGNVIDNNSWGIGTYFAEYTMITGNNITGNTESMVLTYSDHNVISGNNITNNDCGINLDGWSNIVSGNNITNNGVGIRLYEVSGNKFYHNNFIDNTQHVDIQTLGYVNSWNYSYPSGGNYWSNYSGVDLYSGPYQNETRNDGIGDTPYVIDGNNQDNYPLMHQYGSIRNIDTDLTYLTIQSAIDAPETLDGHTIFVKEGTYSEHIVVDKSLSLIGADKFNTIIDGNSTGNVIEVTSSCVNITGFTIQNGGPEFLDSGIHVCYSSGNDISYNIITNNSMGIYLLFSRNNVLSGNNVSSNNWRGIYLYSTSNSMIFHNNFINNTQQVDSINSTNIWDNAYPSGGNYWSNYTGVDLFSGTYQNETGSDGIGDTPYIIDKNNTDNYPLISPWIPPDIAVMNVTPSKTVVGQGYNMSINVTVANQGIYTETFNVILYVNTLIIDTKEIILTSGNSTTITLTWNTTGFAKGSYVLKAIVDAMPGETDKTDNTFTDGQVYVGIPGDVNGDRIVNMVDIYTELISRFMCETGDPCYSANSDINCDGIINMIDIYTAILHLKQNPKSNPNKTETLIDNFLALIHKNLLFNAKLGQK